MITGEGADGKQGGCCRHKFWAAGKEIMVFGSQMTEAPVIYLNTSAEEGEQVYGTLCGKGCRDFTLVTISGLDWNRDMAPWDAPPVSEKDASFTGGAEGYLRLLTEEIVPGAEAQVPGAVLWRGLAGYSLAGLFALYSMYHTGLFSRIASVSGSLWFPGFREYVFSHEVKKPPKCLYLSLGGREHRTGNPYMKTVRTCTEEIQAFYAAGGIDVKLQINPGGHFRDTVQRTAAGIEWLLKGE